MVIAFLATTPPLPPIPERGTCVIEEHDIEVERRAVYSNLVYLTLLIVVRVRAIILRVKSACVYTRSWINLPPLPPRGNSVAAARSIRSHDLRDLPPPPPPLPSSVVFIRGNARQLRAINFCLRLRVCGRTGYNPRGTELAAISSLSISLTRQPESRFPGQIVS